MNVNNDKETKFQKLGSDSFKSSNSSIHMSILSKKSQSNSVAKLVLIDDSINNQNKGVEDKNMPKLGMAYTVLEKINEESSNQNNIHHHNIQHNNSQNNKLEIKASLNNDKLVNDNMNNKSDNSILSPGRRSPRKKNKYKTFRSQLDDDDKIRREEFRIVSKRDKIVKYICYNI
jgi:hypothetical protein